MALITTTRTHPPDTEAREALAREIARLARRVLANYGDEQLLGRRQTRTIAAVKQVVRDELPQAAPALLGRVSRWRRERLLREQIGVEVRKHLGRALLRRADTGEGPARDGAFQLVEVINGVEHYAIAPRAASADRPSA